MSKSIVIIGGGSGGNVARELSGKLDKSQYHITLIDRRDVSIHLIAMPRVNVVDVDNLEKTAFLPFDRIFQGGNGTFKQGIVIGIELKEGAQSGGAVILEGGERIPYDVLVIASGSKWEGAIDFPDNTMQITEFIRANRKAIKDADSIVLAGGGAVGLEFAGEIRDVWPNKAITIVHGGDLLLNDAYPAKFRKTAQKGVEQRGIKVILGDFIDEFPEHGSDSVRTRNGQTLKADLVLKTRGPKPNTTFIVSSLGAGSVSENGKIKLHKTLQLKNHPDIFAMGDVADFKEQSQSMKAMGHAKIVAANIISYFNGKPLTEYKGTFEMAVITNGRTSGVAYVGLLWGIVMGGWFAKMIKSQTLFVNVHAANKGYS
ncbi:FAD/NAD(P)-binding domain-containing protein [Mycena floridula]|nr:FAD/NAD(P)-binding domain-containing protein [Mycena floridula]